MKQRTILMQAGTFIPESVGVQAEAYWHSWQRINSADGDLLERNLRKAGWNFFFLAETVQAIVWGRRGERTMRTALRRVLAKVKSSKFNCVEITEVTQKRFLGLPYVHVSAHSRHIQKSSTMQSLAERSQAAVAVAWAVG